MKPVILLLKGFIGLGLLAQKQGKLDEAISDLSRSEDLRPTARGYLELGRTLAQAGRTLAQAGHIPEAFDAYQRALRISPDLVEAEQAAALQRQNW